MFPQTSRDQVCTSSGEGLNNCMVRTYKAFTQGNDNLVVVTDHTPPVKLFGDRTLDQIANSHLFSLKQRMLPWRSTVVHIPG